MRRSQSGPNAIGIVGLGLIGGSLSKAVAAQYPKRILIGVEPSAKARRLAAKDGIFTRLLARPSAALAECQIVVLCAPVSAILRLLDPVSRRMRKGALLTDLGGVKEPIVAAARKKVSSGVLFVGAHPMFGGEKGGYAAGRGELWKGGTVAVCSDSARPEAIRAAGRFYRGLGARVIPCTAAAHDRAVAAVSHLHYIVASALALTASEAGPLARLLAGQGLRDSTRLAEFAYEIQGQAARGNANLVPAGRRFERHFRRLLDAARAEGPKVPPAFRRARAASGSLRKRRRS
ncbi:MAG TPA: prephenate dehydrogenase/arogenate dehydrogenase family protein [Thermoanaerobaculia bacterium]|nr:prephenate dehydrogenase/arogenate dehydrogenase family protein [Thermoanaerobaculia bacterium]